MKHQKVIKIKTETKRSKIMYRYAKLKRFCRDRQLQVYMYVFMYVDPETIPEGKYFPDTTIFVQN